MIKKGPPIRWAKEVTGIPRAEFEAVYDRTSSEPAPRSPDEIMEWQARRDAMIYSPEGLATGLEIMTDTDAAVTDAERATDQIEVFDLAEDMFARTQKRAPEWWIGEIMTGIMSGELAPIFWPYSDGAARHHDDLVPTQRMDENGCLHPEKEGKPTKGEWLRPIDREWIAEVWASQRGILRDERPTVDEMALWPTGGYRLKCDAFDWVAVYLYPIRIDRAAADLWSARCLVGTADDVNTERPTKYPRDPRTHTGAPGRPTSSHLVETEHAKRCANREASTTLAEEARCLSEWLATEHPDLAQMKASTIENKIRTAHRKYATGHAHEMNDTKAF
ncbi:hypothetical protein [Minwuia sp. IMCC4030]|uniref:hypothetical protein n=1 Tax=Minwuia sp. IMCC4030 TaxID=3040677 RepID=UPI00247935B0|nr:hypothetical protein [Minwuia sp. IMCC4030]